MGGLKKQSRPQFFSGRYQSPVLIVSPGKCSGCDELTLVGC